MAENNEFEIEAFAILDRSNKPLLYRNLTEKEDIEVMAFLETSLDYFEEQMKIATKNPPITGNLGLLSKQEKSLLFGKVLANGVKLILSIDKFKHFRSLIDVKNQPKIYQKNHQNFFGFKINLILTITNLL